jgi:hypothetical protein
MPAKQVRAEAQMFKEICGEGNYLICVDTLKLQFTANASTIYTVLNNREGENLLSKNFFPESTPRNSPINYQIFIITARPYVGGECDDRFKFSGIFCYVN